MARPSTCAWRQSPACTANTSRSGSCRSRRSPRSTSDSRQRRCSKAATRRGEGGVLICGPTGCGKSTTLYTTLELIKSPARKLYTVEDPIERRLEGVVQSEVKSAIGLSFATVLRALLRSDPDAIMVGEVRDLETAKMAAEAAITGHLVFSTLHTRDAASAVHRLIEMGLPPYLVAAAFTCVVSQRLVRRLCPHCRKRHSMSAATWGEARLGEAPRKQMRIYGPVGCGRCFGTGYLGRVGIFEVLTFDDEYSAMVARSAAAGELRAAARSREIETVRQDGLRKVLEGATRLPGASTGHRLSVHPVCSEHRGD